MNTKKVIDLLNKVLSVEYSAVIQYTQYAALLQGSDRRLYREFFEESSKEARGHAGWVSDLIVSNGGIPVVQAAHIRQASEAKEMLEQALLTEREALDTYQKAHDAIDVECALKYMLENQISTEQEDVWEVEKLLRMHQVQVGQKDLNLTAVGSP